MNGAEANRALERLAIITRANAYVQHERAWLLQLEVKAKSALVAPARSVGFGPWRKHYASPADLVERIDQTFRAPLASLLRTELPRPEPTDAPDTFAFAWPHLAGEPPLHEDYVNDAHAFLLNVSQDDTKHVVHRLVVCWMHAFFLAAIAEKRAASAEAVSARTGLSAQQVYTFEVNFCQHYIPSSAPAYFERQPMRAVALDFANRVRKVAFGGQ